MRPGLHYTPSPVREMVGVTVKQHRYGYADNYSGTAEALVAAGLATPDMFPGQPGRPATRVTYRPHGNPSDNIYREEGYITIFRKPHADLFTIERTVSKAEQERRIASYRKQDAEQAQVRSEANAARSAAAPEVADYVLVAMMQYMAATGAESARQKLRAHVILERQRSGTHLRLVSTVGAAS